MSRSARPRYEDFSGRIGERFQVHPQSGSTEMMSWTLSSCERLAPSNGTDDGFRMVFLTETTAPQGTFDLVSGDGFAQVLFASPGGTDWVHVTVN